VTWQDSAEHISTSPFDFHTLSSFPPPHQLPYQYFQIFLSYLAASYQVNWGHMASPRHYFFLFPLITWTFAALLRSSCHLDTILVGRCPIIPSIKPPGAKIGKSCLYLPFQRSYMAGGQGSAAVSVAPTQRRSKRVNRGCNGRDVQLNRLGERLVASTRQKKRSFAPEDGLILENNVLAPATKKKRRSKSSQVFCSSSLCSLYVTDFRLSGFTSCPPRSFAATTTAMPIAHR
jgi:hypothetical protein